jgi:hypothetical protein
MWRGGNGMSKLNEKLRILMANQGWSQKRPTERMAERMNVFTAVAII